MSISVYYDGDFSSGVDAIQIGSYFEEANPALSANLPNGMIMSLSQIHYHLTGAYYETQSTNGGLLQIYADIYNAEDVRIAQSGYKKLSFSKVTASPTYQATYLCDVTLNPSDYTYYAGYDDDPVPAKIYIRLWYERKSGGNTWVDDIQTDAITVTGYPYVFPSMSSFTMNRALLNGTISQQGQYGRYDITSNLAAILASDEPSFIKSAAALTVSFTRGSTDYSHAAASGGTGLLQSGGSALQLGNEETFTVTAALTDGINTVSMSALLSANFAIFNANAAKNSIGIGKYCDGTFTGLDVNMPTMFRKEVTLGVSPWEILWVNQNPSSSFASGDRTMSRAVTEGEMVVCFYKHLSTADNPNMQAFGWVGVVDVRLQIGIATSNNIGTRVLTFTANSNKFNASNCTYNNQTTNSDCVPIFVAALKNMDITSAMLSAWVAPT